LETNASHEEEKQMGGFTLSEMQVINQYVLLTPEARKQLQSYLEFLVVQQCQRELSNQLLHNQWFYNNLLGLQRLSETSDNYCHEVMDRVHRIRSICQGVFEHLFDKYSPVLNSCAVFDGVLDWILIGLNNITEAACSGNSERTRKEIIDLIEVHKTLTRSHPKTRVRAI
jgi:hypothetical protein